MLLLGNYRPALAVARHLDPARYRFIMGLEGSEGFCEHSRFVQEQWAHPPLASGERFLGALLDLLARRPDIRTIFPIAEDFAAFLAAHTDRVPEYLAVASPQPEVVEKCRDKAAMCRLAHQLGIGCEPAAEALSYDEALAVSAELGFPVVIRSINALVRIGRRKAVICASEADFCEQIPALPESSGGFLIQKRAFGQRHNVYFAARDGTLLRHADHVTRRTDHPDGTGLTVSGICSSTPPRLVAETERLTEALRYTGVGLSQFLVDERSGRSTFLELNPRIGGSSAIVEAYGLGLGQAAIAIAHGEEPAPVTLSERDLRFAWLTGDLSGLVKAIRAREIGARTAISWFMRLVGNSVRADVHASWRSDDPLPTIMRYLDRIPFVRRLTSSRKPCAASARPPAELPSR